MKTRGAIRALDPASGDERWRGESTEAGIDGPAFGRNGKRVFVSHDGALRALSVSDGGELWRREFDFTTTAVTRPRSGAGTTLYVGDYDGRLLALSPREGETR